MKQHLHALWQQHYFWVGTVLTSMAIAAIWGTYRFYILVGRRCGKCGRIFGNKRKNKIRLAPDESISIFSTREAKHPRWLPKKLWWPKKRLRWWIRRVDTETYAVCECGWKISVKTSKGPISAWHAWWVWLTDREQYFEDPELSFISEQAARARRSRDFLTHHPELDTPPIVIDPWDEPKDEK